VFLGLWSSICSLGVFSQLRAGTQPHFLIMYVNVEHGCALLRFYKFECKIVRYILLHLDITKKRKHQNHQRLTYQIQVSLVL
jgi:hypothetical protein